MENSQIVYSTEDIQRVNKYNWMLEITCINLVIGNTSSNQNCITVHCEGLNDNRPHRLIFDCLVYN